MRKWESEIVYTHKERDNMQRERERKERYNIHRKRDIIYTERERKIIERERESANSVKKI